MEFLRCVAWTNWFTFPSVLAMGSVTLLDNSLLQGHFHPTPTTEWNYKQLTTQAQSNYQSTNFQLVLSTRNNSNTWGKQAKSQPERKDILSLPSLLTAAISHSVHTSWAACCQGALVPSSSSLRLGSGILPSTTPPSNSSIFFLHYCIKASGK